MRGSPPLLAVPLLPLLGLSPEALAQEAPRLEPAGAAVAGEDGALGTAVNPALAGFDPDAGVALQLRQPLSGGDTGLQVNLAGGGTGFGLAVLSGPETFHVALQTTVALRLPDDWTVGSNFWWHLPEGESNNFTAWDLGAGWRPLPWLGVGAVARDIGSPAPELGVRGAYVVGLALRPLGDPLLLGVEHAWLEGDDPTAPLDRALRATARVRPLRGLALRAYVTDALEVGGGLEINLGGTAVGGWAGDVTGDTPSATLALFSADPRERILSMGRRVASLRLDDDYPYEPRDTLFTEGGESWFRVLERLRALAHDRSVRGIVLHLDGLAVSLARIEELRDLVAEARAAGKPVVVYLDESSGTGAYYLATAADRIVLHPAADLDLKGVSAELTYFRGTLDLLGVEPQFVRRSEYKSGPESFTRTGPSDADREQTEALLDDIHGAVVAAVATGRGLPPEEARALVEGGPWTAEEALQHGLVDALLYPDDLEEGLTDPFTDGYDLDEETLAREDRSGWRAPRAIAVIVVEGPITSGESSGPGLLGGGSTGADTIVQALDQAREDPAVKAVVLRVDSPGGSAFASEDIAHAVDRVREEGKPVVASMGGVAASGGYYVVSGADVVFAQPSTITGSIGVYGGRFSLAGLYDKIGVDAVVFSRGRHAAMEAVSRPWDASDLAVMERLIEDTYRRFKTRVGEGRSLDAAAVEEVARGRVWTGVRAREVGLVDETGGFYDAVDRARVEAGLSERARYELITYQSTRDALGDLPARLLRAATPEVETPAALETLRTWSALEGEQVLLVMPYSVEVR